MLRLTMMMASILVLGTGCHWIAPCGGGSDLTCDNPAADVQVGEYFASECSQDPCLEADVDISEDAVDMVITDEAGNTWRVTWPREEVDAPAP